MAAHPNLAAKPDNTGSFSKTQQDWVNAQIATSEKNLKAIQINALDYGVVGNGTHDDTQHLQNFLNDFVKLSAGDLKKHGVNAVIPPGTYRTTSKLTINFTATSTTPKMLSAYGARILPTISSGHTLEITTPASGNPNVRNLSIFGLMIEGTNATDTSAALIHMAGGGGGGFIFRINFTDLCLEQFNGDGLYLDSGVSDTVFEVALVSPHFNAKTGNQVGSCLNSNNAAGLDVFGGTMSGGLHNVLIQGSGSGGIKIHGGSYLSAFNEGILINTGSEVLLDGAHVEVAWQGGAASPSWTTSQAGILIGAHATLVNVTGTQNNSKMRYVARLIPTGVSATVVGGLALNTDYYLRAEAGAGGDIVAIGLDTGNTGAIHDAGGGRIVQVGTKGANDLVQLDRGALQIARATPTYSTSITPDVSAGNWQIITVTDAVAFTINAPSNPPDGSHTADLVIEIHNNSGGAMGAITWASGANGFRFPGITWVNPGSGNYRYVAFKWSPNRALWIAHAFTGADY